MVGWGGGGGSFGVVRAGHELFTSTPPPGLPVVSTQVDSVEG